MPTFRNRLNERSAYKAMFFHQLDLDELDPAEVNGLPAARDNAHRLAEELNDTMVEKVATQGTVYIRRSVELTNRFKQFSNMPKTVRQIVSEPSANLNIRPPISTFNRFVN